MYQTSYVFVKNSYYIHMQSTRMSVVSAITIPKESNFFTIKLLMTIKNSYGRKS